MKIIDRSAIDVKRWNALVNCAPLASFFSYSWYLDAVAENWCILVNDDYTKGLALPYTKRMGVELLYIPIFSRSMQAFGALSQEDLRQIQERFSVIELATTTALFSSDTRRVHQVITDFHQRKLSSQAKRSLKKATNSGVEVTGSTSFELVFKAIEQELQDKFKGVDAERLKRLKNLFVAAESQSYIKVFEVSGGSETGGIVCLQNETELLYVKGACPENLKKIGGMYTALNAAIEFAKENDLRFDFGGSNIEGVQRFNKNLGGADQSYYFHEENNAPIWFKWARKMKNRGSR